MDSGAARGLAVGDVFSHDLAHELDPDRWSDGARRGSGPYRAGSSRQKKANGFGIRTHRGVDILVERAEEFDGLAVAAGVLIREAGSGGLAVGDKAAAFFGEGLGLAEHGETFAALPTGHGVGELDRERIVGAAGGFDGVGIDLARDAADPDDDGLAGFCYGSTGSDGAVLDAPKR